MQFENPDNKPELPCQRSRGLSAEGQGQSWKDARITGQGLWDFSRCPRPSSKARSKPLRADVGLLGPSHHSLKACVPTSFLVLPGISLATFQTHEFSFQLPHSLFFPHDLCCPVPWPVCYPLNPLQWGSRPAPH